MLRTFVRGICSRPPVQKLPISVFGIEGRYVKALYNAALQLNQIDQVEKCMRDLQKELQKPKMAEFIETSMLSRTAKAKLLQEIVKQAAMPDAVSNFLAVVAENGRLKLLKRMINMFLTVMVAHRYEAHCEVITAKPLDDNSRKLLMDALQKYVKSNKKITLIEKVDSSIIGGMIVSIEDTLIDMSIARKIKIYTDILQKAV